MNTVHEILAFAAGVFFQLFGVVVLVYLFSDKRDWHRIPRLVSFLGVNMIVLKWIHDGLTGAPWEAYFILVFYLVGIYSMISLALWIAKAARKHYGDVSPICETCPYREGRLG